MKSTPLARTQRVVVDTKVGTLVFRSVNDGERFRISAPKSFVDYPDILIRQNPLSLKWEARLKGSTSGFPTAVAATPKRAFKLAVRHSWGF